MRLLRKKTELQVGETLITAVETVRRATEAAGWLLKLVNHQQEEIARLQAELSVRQAFRDYPSLSTYVH